MSVSRPPSAYPLAFPEALASEGILPICCLRLAPAQQAESKQRVTSFLITGFESVGWCFLPGLVGMHPGRSCKRPPLSFAFWQKLFSLIWLGCTHDRSDTPSMSAIHRLMLDGMTE